MSTKPTDLCSTLNFGLLDNHGNQGSVGIVFLYKPGTDNLNFHLCAKHNEDEVYGAKKFCLVVSYSQSIFILYLCIWMQKNLIFDPKMIQKQQAKKSTRGAFWWKGLIYYIKSELSNE